VAARPLIFKEEHCEVFKRLRWFPDISYSGHKAVKSNCKRARLMPPFTLAERLWRCGPLTIGRAAPHQSGTSLKRCLVARPQK
jgi:hypothetical protein